MSRKIEDLVPEMQEIAKELLAKASDALGMKVISTYTKRSVAEQTAFYAQGREPLGSVNAKRKAAGMPPISERENKNKVTWTMKSKHIEGKAIDVGIMNEEGALNWDTELFEVIGEIGESLGLTWGGRWNNKDYPHFQMD